MIREVNVSQLTDVVERLCIEANEHLPSDVKCAIEPVRMGRLPRGYSIISLKIIRLQMPKMYRSVRIQEWPVCSWRLGRMYI